MGRKTRCKVVVDCLLLCLLVLAMANKLTGNSMHEVIGACMLLLLLLHNALNWQWFTAVPKRVRTLQGVFESTVTGLLWVALGALLGSGIMISRTLFAFLGMEGNLFLRQLHTTAAHWLLILIAVHLGMHWARFASGVRKIVPLPSGQWVHASIRPLLPLAIVAGGVKASFAIDLCAKLFMAHAFDFLNPNEAVAVVFLKYLAIIGASVVITDTVLKAFRFKSEQGPRMYQIATRAPDRSRELCK